MTNKDMSKSKRRHRARDKSAGLKGNLDLDDRQKEILYMVWRLRVMTHNQLQRYFLSNPEKSEGANRIYATRELRKLFNHDYLARQFWSVIGGGRSPACYVLNKKGAEALRELGCAVTWHYSYQYLKEDYLKHSVAIAEFMLMVIKGCEELGIELVEWQSESELKSRHAKLKKAHKKNWQSNPSMARVKFPGSEDWQILPVIPDLMFTIKYRDKVLNFCCEVDRTMNRGKFMRKLFVYRTLEQSEVAVKYKVKKSKAELNFGVKNVRVLTVISTEAKNGGDKKLWGYRSYLDDPKANKKYRDAVRRLKTDEWVGFSVLAQLTPTSIFAESVWHRMGIENPIDLFSLHDLKE